MWSAQRALLRNTRIWETTKTLTPLTPLTPISGTELPRTTAEAVSTRLQTGFPSEWSGLRMAWHISAVATRAWQAKRHGAKRRSDSRGRPSLLEELQNTRQAEKHWASDHHLIKAKESKERMERSALAAGQAIAWQTMPGAVVLWFNHAQTGGATFGEDLRKTCAIKGQGQPSETLCHQGLQTAHDVERLS